MEIPSFLLHYRTLRIVFTLVVFTVFSGIVYVFVLLFASPQGTLHLLPDDTTITYDVWVDNVHQGKFSGEKKIAVSVGTHDITVFVENYVQITEKVSIERGGTVNFPISFVPKRDLYQITQHFPYKITPFAGGSVFDNQYIIFCSYGECLQPNTRVLGSFPERSRPYHVLFATGSYVCMYRDDANLYWYDLNTNKTLMMAKNVVAYDRIGSDKLAYIQYDYDTQIAHVFVSDLYGVAPKEYGRFPVSSLSSLAVFGDTIFLGLSYQKTPEIHDIVYISLADGKVEYGPQKVYQFAFRNGYTVYGLSMSGTSVTRILTSDGKLYADIPFFIYPGQTYIVDNIIYFYDIKDGIYAYDRVSNKKKKLLDLSHNFPQDILFRDMWVQASQNRMYFIDTKNRIYYFPIPKDE